MSVKTDPSRKQTADYVTVQANESAHAQEHTQDTQMVFLLIPSSIELNVI